MDYKKIYNDLVCRAKLRGNIEGYTETHHIVPKSLGGSDSPDNLVILTAREHYIAHALLPKFLCGEDKSKMIYALWRVSNSNNVKVNSRVYEYVRSEFSKRVSARMKGNQNTTGFKHSDEERLKRSLRMLGNSIGPREQTSETRKKISESKIGNIRPAFSDEWKANLSAAARSRPPVSAETKAKLSSHTGVDAPYIKTYVAVSPTGERFIVECGLRQFCSENMLSEQKLRKYLGKGPVPQSTNIGRPSTKLTLNTDGWELNYDE